MYKIRSDGNRNILIFKDREALDIWTEDIEHITALSLSPSDRVELCRAVSVATEFNKHVTPLKEDDELPSNIIHHAYAGAYIGVTVEYDDTPVGVFVPIYYVKLENPE